MLTPYFPWGKNLQFYVSLKRMIVDQFHVIKVFRQVLICVGKLSAHCGDFLYVREAQ